MMAELGLDPAADPARLSGGEARRAALVRALEPRARHPAAGRADQPPRSHRHRVAGGAARAEPLGARAHQPRQAAARRPDAGHDLARPRPHAPARPGLRRFRGLARREARGGGARAPQARPQDRRAKSTGCATASPRGASATCAGSASSPICDASGARPLRPTGAAAMTAQDAKASGALVIDAERVSKAYGGRAIVRDFSLRVMRGDRIGIVGANGVGKTTLVKLLTGALAPNSGSVRLGANVAMASLDQWRASLEPATTLVDALTGGGSDYVDDQRRAAACHGLHARLPVSARAGAYADRQIVGRRARAADARAGVGEAVQPAGSRRADQRSRHRDARPAAGDAWRLCRNDPARQPRSRFSRSRRDLGHRRRGRRAVGRICRRLFRHGRPARARAGRSARPAGRGGGEAGEAADG